VQEGEQVIFGEQGRFHAGETVEPKQVNLASLGVE